MISDFFRPQRVKRCTTFHTRYFAWFQLVSNIQYIGIWQDSFSSLFLLSNSHPTTSPCVTLHQVIGAVGSNDVIIIYFRWLVLLLIRYWYHQTTEGLEYEQLINGKWPYLGTTFHEIILLVCVMVLIYTISPAYFSLKNIASTICGVMNLGGKIYTHVYINCIGVRVGFHFLTNLSYWMDYS